MNEVLTHDFLYTSVVPLFGVQVIIKNRDRNEKREEWSAFGWMLSVKMVPLCQIISGSVMVNDYLISHHPSLQIPEGQAVDTPRATSTLPVH